MANPYINKVVLGNETLLDLTADTVTPQTLYLGVTAHDASGAMIIGTATDGTMVIRDSQDSHGGTVREITAGTVVTGTKSITANGTYDVAAYADAQVNVPAPEPELQAKTATPSTSQQVITADSGYDGLSQVTVSAMPSGSASTPATSITANPSISVNSSTGLITASVSGSKSVTPSVSAGYVSSGTAGTVSVSGSNTSQLTTQAAKTVTPSTSSQTAVAAGRYTTGAVTVAAMPSGTAGTPTATKGTVSNHAVSVTPSVTNTAGYISGGTKTGTAVSVSASELVSGTLSITSSGTKDVTNYASASVAAGGATASATKGAVSNHSITVTPSVTRTAGYVTAGSANGTAVTVTAAELVSGTKSITENGTGIDVTEYASVDVNVGGGGGTLVTGTFTTGGTRAARETVSINYAGSGYPLAYVVYCSSVSSNYDVSSFSAVKNTASEPSWTTSADVNNTSTATYIYKQTQLIGALSTNAASYMGAQYTASSAFNCVKFIGNGTTLGYYIGNATSTTLGLAPSTTYNYLIVYSS